MVKAKPGYEDLYEAVVAKQAKLDAEKESRIKEATDSIEAEFAVKTKELADLFAQVSVEVEDPAVEETINEPEEVTEQVVNNVEPVVAG